MRLLIVVALAAAAVGCKRRAEAPLVFAVDPVSEPDAKTFADKLIAVAKQCHPLRLSPLIDHQALAAKFATTSKLPNADKAARAMMRQQAAAPLLCNLMRGVAEYKLLRVKMVGTEPHPIMRRMMRDPRTGATLIGYDELQLGTTRSDRQVRLVDTFFYVQGQWLTQVLGSNAFETLPQLEDVLRKVRELQRAGKHSEAISTIDKLAPEIRNHRYSQTLRVQSAAVLGGESFKQALDELARVFPDDPSIAMVEMDGAFAVGDHDKALKWIDVIDKAVGGDPFQQVNRAVAYLRKGDADKAAEHIEAAIKLEPTLQRAWEVKLDIGLKRKKWSDVIAAMTELEKLGMKFDPEKLKSVPSMAELVTTPEYKQWLANRK